MDGLKLVMAEIDSIMSRAELSAQFGDLKRLVHELEESVDTLESQSVRTKALETSLEQHEDKLSRADTDFIASIGPVLSAIGVPDFEVCTNYDLSSAGAASAEIPLVLQQYYDMLGDVSNLQERLRDLDIDHTQELHRRELLADQDHQAHVSDEIFYRDHDSHRQSVLREFEEAQISLQHLRSLCKANGLDPDTRDYVRSATSQSQSGSPVASSGAPTPVLAHTHSVYSPPEPSSSYDHNGQGPMVDRVSQGAGAKIRKGEAVNHWLDEVTAQSNGPSNAFIEEVGHHAPAETVSTPSPWIMPNPSPHLTSELGYYKAHELRITPDPSGRPTPLTPWERHKPDHLTIRPVRKTKRSWSDSDVMFQMRP
ncbi:hypothetical protein M8818_000813 [Zalaria obscura]|uniref:Uncharacterized protein n=1 Tax=Zalaria obscura TaxID=2024903 RepID=A0ACC3SMH1_9PEZI